MEIKLIDFQQHGDERGMLVALEENKEIPFDIKRVYYMYATKENVRRGYHAHKKITTNTNLYQWFLHDSFG